MSIERATYKPTSPYNKTSFFGDRFLDIMEYKSLPAQADDIYQSVSATYHLRPDLMSFDLYGTVDFWYVFMLRNIDVIKDPIYDFKEGTRIYIPKKTTIINSLE
jgi:hypothetical protein